MNNSQPACEMQRKPCELLLENQVMTIRINPIGSILMSTCAESDIESHMILRFDRNQYENARHRLRCGDRNNAHNSQALSSLVSGNCH